MKRIVLLTLMSLLALGGVSAQQFAKTGVVNLTRINQFYKDAKSKAVEDLKLAIQKDLDRLKEEIRLLNDQRIEANKKGDSARVQALDSEIQIKRDAFTEFGRAKQEELAAAAESLKSDTTFQKLLPQEIEQAAISKGFALIVNSSNPVVIWYGPDADITDDVIQRLQADLSR